MFGQSYSLICVRHVLSSVAQRCPSLNFLLEPEPSFFGFVFLGEPEPELFWFSFFRGSQSQSFFSFLFFGELEPELAKLDRPGSS